MNFPSLIAGALTISILHAMLPSHWLAFVLVGSAQRWRRRKIMRVAFLAGSGHVLMTTVLGLATASIAQEILPYLGYLETYATSGILIVLGLVYILLGIRHKGSNVRPLGGEASSRAAEASLFLMLTFSPCEAIIPLFFAASTLGWNILLALSLLISLSTIGGIVTLTYLTMVGYEKIHFTWLQENERTLIGAILLVLGVITIMID